MTNSFQTLDRDINNDIGLESENIKNCQGVDKIMCDRHIASGAVTEIES